MECILSCLRNTNAYLRTTTTAEMAPVLMDMGARVCVFVRREMTLGQLVERTSGTALIKTDVQTEEDVTGEDAPVLFQYVDIKPPTPPPHTVPASSTISTARSGGVLFPVKKRLAPNQLAEVLCPRSKERRTRMAPCRAAC